MSDERGRQVLRWAYEHLPSPSDPTEPLVLSDDQARFVLEMYRTAGDRPLYRRAALQMPKGWGKSPLGAVICLAEFAGPVAPRVPWVQLAASSEEQAASNVYVLIWSMLSENHNAAAAALGIDLGRGRLYLPAVPGAKLEAVTSSAPARDGQRVTFALLDETQNWNRHNGGDKLARTIRRNASKTNGRVLELSNAPELGMDTVAEATEAEAATDGGILFVANRPSSLPTPDMTEDQLRELLAEVYQGAPWVDLDRVLVDVRGAGAPWQESVRYFFNVPSAGSGAAVDPITWSQQRRDDRLKPGERIGLGFDGSISGDATALVACTVDGLLVPLLISERPVDAPEGWRIDRAEVHQALEDAFERFDVGYLYADPPHWRAEVERWAEQWPDRVVAFWTATHGRMVPAIDRFRTELQEGRLFHTGDKTLTRHVLNARLRRIGNAEGRYKLEKSGPGRLIDACIAAVLATQAVAVMPTEAPTPREPARCVNLNDIPDDEDDW